MARKGIFAGLEPAPAVNSGSAPSSARLAPLPFSSGGAPGALTRSIDTLAARANSAKDLEARLTSGQVIVELNAGSIDPSFVTDRMVEDDEAY